MTAMDRLKKAMQLLLNRTDPIAAARKLGVTVGNRCRFIATDSATFGSEPYLVTIGEHVTITAGVRFVTHDGGVWILRDEFPDLDIVAPIAIGNNVFIGLNVMILPGVTVGNNVVLAAGSVVTRDIPSNSVAAGVPARTIKSVEKYRENSIDIGIRTKGMPVAEKRALLQKRFFESSDGE